MSGKLKFIDEPVKVVCLGGKSEASVYLQQMAAENHWQVTTVGSVDPLPGVIDQEDGFQLVFLDWGDLEPSGDEVWPELCKKYPDARKIVVTTGTRIQADDNFLPERQIFRQHVAGSLSEMEIRTSIGNALESYFLEKRSLQLAAELERCRAELRAVNDNLSSLVEERTEKLQFQNQALRISQNILDSLPVGVIGLDFDGTIVKTNAITSHLLRLPVEHLIGLPREEFLPDELNQLVDRLEGKNFISGRMQIRGALLNTWAILMKNGQQEGIILAFAPDEDEAE